ncbi:MAG: aminotransferase class I/II-fold pyridoxal phosphate-dependent enzyme [Firmicutes bacterium]|nr:aminotransferase class I/II-fold pyridoxal phosphate-dependent enzyme [Bacillota bacterium]
MEKKHLRTRLAHTGDVGIAKKIHAGVSVPKVLPIYMTSVFSFDDVPTLDAVYEGNADGYVYTRMTNPGTDAVEEILAAAEDADGALVFSSGMAAIVTSIIANVKSGDHIISSPVLYGGVYDYFKNELPRFGVEVTFVDFEDFEAVKAAVRPETKVFYTETISNPLMEVIDIPAIAEIAHANGCKLIIDNTFATPAVCRPLEHGADIVVYSTTKFLGGHSDLTGGAILSDAENIAQLRRYFTLYGAIMGPFEAWLLARSLRTLDLRMKAHSENALKVAEFLEKHPKVERVYYPGLASSKYKELADKLFVEGRCGGMLSADIAGGEEGASTLIKECPTIKLVPSLAGFSTTISYPAKTSHRAYSPEDMEAAGISMGQLRFSIGIEDADDIIAELAEALDQIEL